KPARIFNRPDDGLPPRSEERGSPCQKDQQCPHLPGRDYARCRTAKTDRRFVELVRRQHATGHGAADRLRQAHARRFRRTTKDPPEPCKEGEAVTLPGVLSPLANHLWQSTVFAAAAGLLTLALQKKQARTRYWIWLFGSLKFLVPFSLFIAI